MVMQCTCDCNCSSVRDCLPRGTKSKEQQQEQQDSPAMEQSVNYYRRLSNSSSALYGSCPQLPQTAAAANVQQHTASCNSKRQVTAAAAEARSYSSLLHAKLRDAVLCNKCAL
ncbi:uncharacterized protein LOC117134703 [Drosophila busckii]|uniref:uncharacterized protein LOC117134703 n=1 Tax=Drosophila busckii TaxID=30019 RepID=UPI0014329A38|nr:uncharacterized protein LOC117134703 [Drosophila busckii]